MSAADADHARVADWDQAYLASVGSQGRSYAERLGRGPYYVARGAVKALDVQRGRATATFLHGRQRSQQVVLEVGTLDDDAWEAMVHALAAELRFTAAIADGDLPPEAAGTLAEAGVQLVPPREQIAESCTCSESDGPPCRHIASLHHALADGFVADPFLLLRLRGRDPATLRAALRAVRTGGAIDAAARSPDALGIADLEVGDPFDARGDLESVTVQPHRVEDAAWLFDQLGEPPGIPETEPLQQLIRRAADTAWRIAAGDGSEAADTELLLAELRAQRMSTPPKLADALGWEPDTALGALEELYEQGAVMRMGEGMTAKYRSAS